jgi:hypothetical protein
MFIKLGGHASTGLADAALKLTNGVLYTLDLPLFSLCQSGLRLYLC